MTAVHPGPEGPERGAVRPGRPARPAPSVMRRRPMLTSGRKRRAALQHRFGGVSDRTGGDPVTTDRTARVWAAIHACALRRGERASVRHACVACAGSMGALGAGLTMLRSGNLREPVYATGSKCLVLVVLLFFLGVGLGVVVL